MTLEEAFREMESNLEEADQEELEEDFLSWKEEKERERIMQALEKAIDKYNPKNIRYFYFPYKGEIACIPEWFICRHRPKNMFELEDVAKLWLERNKQGDFGEDHV